MTLQFAIYASLMDIWMIYLHVPLAKVVFAGKRKMISLKRTILKSLIDKLKTMSKIIKIEDLMEDKKFCDEKYFLFEFCCKVMEDIADKQRNHKF